MGFMGLNDWGESDMAADFHARLRLKIREEFRRELKNEANCYNTPGWLNALLIFKEYPDLMKFLDLVTIERINKALDEDDGYLKIEGGGALVQNFKALLLTRRING